MTELMIYGGGYTSRLICEQALHNNLDFVLAGRNTIAITALASTLKVQHRIFCVDNITTMDAALDGIRVLINCAGPFAGTAKPLMDECIRQGVHYLDVSAEIETYITAEKLGEQASKAGVMLLPGSGGSVAMIGCLVGHALEGLGAPLSIDVVLRVAGSMSRGSATSAAEGMTAGALQRRGGRLVPSEEASKDFDFNDGKGGVACYAITLPDLVAMWKSHGVGDIRTFVHASDASFPTGDLSEMPDGPTAEERKMTPYVAAVEIKTADGSFRRAVLHTLNGYTFTAVASIEAAKRVLDSKFIVGFQTPVCVFGSDFVESIPGTSMQVL
jgi:short subunit dehydrogenase-like uncharacterized protein